MGDVLTMPDGSWFEVVRSPSDPARDPSEVVFTAHPGGPAPPPHVHPHQRETFTLEEGDFAVLGRVGPLVGLRPAPPSAARAD